MSNEQEMPSTVQRLIHRPEKPIGKVTFGICALLQTSTRPGSGLVWDRGLKLSRFDQPLGSFLPKGTSVDARWLSDDFHESQL